MKIVFDYGLKIYIRALYIFEIKIRFEIVLKKMFFNIIWLVWINFTLFKNFVIYSYFQEKLELW